MNEPRPSAEAVGARIPAGGKRRAMDWSLALASQGIEATIDLSDEAGWGLIVDAQDYERARSVIHQYRIENLRWPWRRKIFQPGILFDWGSLAWVFLLGLFFWISEESAGLSNLGLMDATAVARGEWWRLFTAIFLHANAAHLAANATIGLVLLGLTMGRYGTGVGLLAAYLAGAGGNVAAWLLYPEGHRSLGASGMVMGCVGLLAAQSVSISRKDPQGLRYLLSGIFGGVMLFALLGLGPGTDVAVHFGGFVGGVLIGIVLTLAPRLAQNPAVNIFAGAVFCSVVILTWWLALTGGG